MPAGTLGALDRVEINEAFAAVPWPSRARAAGRRRQCRRGCGGPWPSDRRNRRGTDDKTDHAMRRTADRGLVTLCIGGGQGIALAIEATALRLVRLLG